MCQRLGSIFTIPAVRHTQLTSAQFSSSIDTWGGVLPPTQQPLGDRGSVVAAGAGVAAEAAPPSADPAATDDDDGTAAVAGSLAAPPAADPAAKASAALAGSHAAPPAADPTGSSHGGSVAPTEELADGAAAAEAPPLMCIASGLLAGERGALEAVLRKPQPTSVAQ